MKIVHTADWHVGKTLRGKSRSAEYRDILQELKLFLKKESVDILLLSGDIFDSSTPSAESEDIVYNFFHDIAQMKIDTVAIAGNHDSGLRFEAISPLMAIAGITMRGFLPKDTKGKLNIQDEKAKVTITTRNGEKAQIVPIPFVSEKEFVRASDVTEDKSTTTIYSKDMRETMEKYCSSFSPEMLHIVVAHILMHGARPGGGEKKLYLGDNYGVYPEDIPANVDYFALGHIHLFQQISAKMPVFYPGSPLQLDFGESYFPKGFLFLDAHVGSPCNPVFIEFQSGKKLMEIEGSLEEITALVEKNPELQNAYLKVTIRTQSQTMGLSSKLKKILPDAVDIRREYPATSPSPLPQTTDWLPSLYQEYCQKYRQAQASPQIMQEFQKFYEKCTKKN